MILMESLMTFVGSTVMCYGGGYIEAHSRYANTVQCELICISCVCINRNPVAPDNPPPEVVFAFHIGFIDLKLMQKIQTVF